MVAGTLETKWAAREVRGEVTVDIIPERIAPVDIRVESTPSRPGPRSAWAPTRDTPR